MISYIEMCRREGTSLQAGMNFGLGGTHSVILMSLRPGAPYRDSLEDGGTGASDDLHFDHDVPWVKGGTFLVAANVQLLCARHNLAKRDHIV